MNKQTIISIIAVIIAISLFGANPILGIIGFYAVLAFILKKPIKAFINWTKYWSEKE